MKTICTLIICLCSSASYAQHNFGDSSILISGKAFSSGDRNNYVRIIRNDTLEKFISSHETLRAENFRKYIELYDRLSRDTANVVFVNNDSNFHMRVYPGDTLMFSSNRYVREKHAVKDLINRPEIIIRLQKQQCLEIIPCRDTAPGHYAFIGEKVSVAYVSGKNYCGSVSMDSRYYANYRIVENLYGGYPDSTIKFEAYDHYGTPAFAEHQFVLLFVSRYCNELIHEKYWFASVYKNTENKWAVPYTRYLHDSAPDIVPVKMKFQKTANRDLSKFTTEQIRQLFPAQYYRIRKNKAIPLYGDYMPEVMEMEKRSVMKKRNFFNEKTFTEASRNQTELRVP